MFLQSKLATVTMGIVDQLDDPNQLIWSTPNRPRWSAGLASILVDVGPIPSLWVTDTEPIP